MLELQLQLASTAQPADSLRAQPAQWARHQETRTLHASLSSITLSWQQRIDWRALCIIINQQSAPIAHTLKLSCITAIITGGSRLTNWGQTLPSLPLSYPSLPFPSTVLSPLPFPFPPLPLEVGPFNTARRYGERCKFPSGVWGGAPAEIEFGAF